MIMYSIYDNKFIGYNNHFEDEEFTGSDNQELFNENLRTMPEDWYYRTAKVTYKRNAWGHRCKPITDINVDNYILTTGCSLTEGVGLEIQNTYTHVLAEKLNCDYYNLGLGGSGVDAMFHNLVMWLADMPHKPKLVVIQWPYWVRFLHFNKNPTSCDMSENEIYPGSVHTNSKVFANFINSGEDINYFETVETLNKIKLEHLLKYTYNIPCIHTGIPYGNRKPLNFVNDYVELIRRDYARDNHHGILSHKELAENLYEIAITKHNL